MDLALKQGHQITAYVRSPEKITIKIKRIKVIKGSLEDVQGMAKAMKGQAAVLSALGPKPGEVFTALNKRSWTMEKSASNILSAMKKSKVKKLVVFSTAGLFPSRNLFVKLLSAIAHNHMEDLKRMEIAVTKSSVNWTIIRPNWLEKGMDKSYRAQINALPPKPLKMSFRALAQCMLDTAVKGLYPRQIIGLGK
jgi:putative NADH-flavin reductase